MKIKEIHTYSFQANLQFRDTDKTYTEYWPFQVIADTPQEAEQILKEYLQYPENTGIKYIQCVGIRPTMGGSILLKESSEIEKIEKTGGAKCRQKDDYSRI